MKELKYAYIDFIALNTLNISINEYIICDMVSKLQIMNGYCYASHDYFAKCLGLTERGIIKIMHRLIEKGLIIVIEKKLGKTNKISISTLWSDTVIFTREQSSNTTELSSLPTEQSSYNNNINISIDKEHTKPIAKAKVKKELELKNPSSEVNAMLLYFYGKLVPAETTGRRFAPQNRKAMDSMLSTYGEKDVRETIDKAKELLGKQYKPQVQSVQTLLAKYEQIKAEKAIIKHQPTKSF